MYGFHLTTQYLAAKPTGSPHPYRATGVTPDWLRQQNSIETGPQQGSLFFYPLRGKIGRFRRFVAASVEIVRFQAEELKQAILSQPGASVYLLTFTKPAAS